jgi:hypothetical protein
MRIRMLADISGTIDGQDWPRKGNEFDVPENVAADLFANGFAEPVTRKTAKVETTTADLVTETAAEPKPRARRAAKE